MFWLSFETPSTVKCPNFTEAFNVIYQFQNWTYWTVISLFQDLSVKRTKRSFIMSQKSFRYDVFNLFLHLFTYYNTPQGPVNIVTIINTTYWKEFTCSIRKNKLISNLANRVYCFKQKPLIYDIFIVSTTYLNGLHPCKLRHHGLSELEGEVDFI